MGKGRKKKNANSTIPTKLTSSLTDEMRSSLGTEEFENTQSNVSTPSSLPMSVTQRSSQMDLSIRSKDPAAPGVTILPRQPPIEYQNSCLSIFEVTAGTASLDSLQSINSDLKKKLIEKTPLKSGEQQEVHTLIEHFTVANPGYSMGIPQVITDYTFVEGTRADGPHAFLTGEKHRLYKFSEEEHNIINTMISDVNKMIQDSGRSNVSISFKIEKGNNGIPSLAISLVPCYYPQPEQDYISRRNEVTMVKYLLEEKLYREQHCPTEKRQLFNPNRFYAALCRMNNMMDFLRFLT